MEKIEQLREKGLLLRQRIAKYEEDLKQPLKGDLEDNAAEEADREVLYGLYKIEKENLVKLEEDIRELM